MVTFARTGDDDLRFDVRMERDGRPGEERTVAFLNRLAILDRVEVKSDQQPLDHGKVAIETFTGVEPPGRPSGLSTSIADTWVYEVLPYDLSLVFSTTLLRETLAREQKQGNNAIPFVHTRPRTGGLLIPVHHLVLTALTLRKPLSDR